jgi:DNA ligase-associated metallophosphoesterase
MPSQLEITLAGEHLLATAEGALVWPAHRTLFIADLHIGKDATFRAKGRALPPGTTGRDLARLTALLNQHLIETLVLLGDAFHSEHAAEEETCDALGYWRSEHSSIGMQMVVGNHDRRATHLAAKVGWELLDEGTVATPWILRHHPGESRKGYVLSGHLHPTVRMRGAGRQSLKVPCFWLGERSCVLPAFSGFTGGSLIRPDPGDRVLVLAGGEVIPVT